MKAGRSSRTAAYAALWRALGHALPEGLALCDDPLAWSFSPRSFGPLRTFAERRRSATVRLLLASPLRRLLLWIQVRTRAIDDIARSFWSDGGRQIVLLGAGFDSRAVRLGAELRGARFFEVDHPATQARKRSILEAVGVDAGAAFLPWDFETDPLHRLGSELERLGLDRACPTLTIWEGVIPYLTERAVEATLRAVGELGGPGSLVVLHYLSRERIEARTLFHAVAARVGEPLQFGWDPEALPGWLRDRDYSLESDRSDEELGRALLAGEWQHLFRGAGGRIAIARPRAR